APGSNANSERMRQMKLRQMETQRWKQIDELFQASLAVERARRAEVLRAACAGDEELRHEVAALIAEAEDAGVFLETPPLRFHDSAPATEDTETVLAR